MPDSAPSIGPYEPQVPDCRDNDYRAPAVARLAASMILGQLPHAEVEHIGSTAVPGCARRETIDLLIPVHGAELEDVKQGLDELGFQWQSGPDPFPESRPMCVGSVIFDEAVFLLHVHVVPADSPEVEELRFFRACLRADPDLVKAYVACKRAILASGVTDSLEYCRRKGGFIEQVLG